MVPAVVIEGERISVGDMFTKTKVGGGKCDIELSLTDKRDVDALKPLVGHEVDCVEPDDKGSINGNSGAGGRIDPVNDTPMVLTDVKLV